MQLTLFTDESGRFEPDQDPERNGRVIGGALLTGGEAAVDEVLRLGAKRLNLQWPVHATDVPAELRGEWQRLVFQVLRENAGEVHVLVVPPVDPNGYFGLNAKLYGDFLEQCLRARVWDGEELTLVFATRERTWSGPHAREARAAGVVETGVRLGGDGRERPRFETFLQNEAAAIAHRVLGRPVAFRAVPWTFPRAADPIHVREATPAGLVMADTICNWAWNRLANSRGQTVPLWPADAGPRPTFFVYADGAGLERLRDRDRALARTPIDVVALARLQLDQAAQREWFTTEERDTVATLIADGLRHALATDQRNLLVGLESDVRRTLAVKSGSYEAESRALDICLNSNAMSAISDDPLLTALLWRHRVEVCNHQGDVVGAFSAFDKVAKLPGRGLAFELVKLDVLHLANVAAQNKLPATDTLLGQIGEGFRAQANELGRLAVRVESARIALGGADGETDPLVGRMLGTAARSLGFLEDWDAADALLLRAREHFHSRADLQFNRIVRVRLQTAAGNGVVIGEELAAIEATDAQGCRDPDPWIRRLRDPGARFLFSAILRGLALGVQVQGVERETWRAALSQDELFSALANGEMTHPTELIGRHAWEITRQRRWAELSLEVSRRGKSTLNRIGEFTLHLLTGRAPVGPPGAILNPTFEYR